MSSYGKYPKMKDGSERKAWPVTECTEEERMTVQADRDEADINKIVARFQKSGQLPPTLRGEPFYGDVSEFGDLQDSLIRIQEADALFMSFPAHIRERFQNDKVKFVQFMSDERNYDEAVKLGIVQAKPVAPAAPAGEPAKPASGTVIS